MPPADTTDDCLLIAEACEVSAALWRKIASRLAIDSVEDVERACHQHQFRRMNLEDDSLDPVNLQIRLQQALAEQAWGRTTFALRNARSVASDIFSGLQTELSVLRLAITGAVRCMAPRVAVLELLATGHDVKAVQQAFDQLPMWHSVEHPRDGVSRAVSHIGLPVALTVLDEDPEAFFRTLVVTTGPNTFIESVVGEHTVEAKGIGSEESMLAAMDLPIVPPECREWPMLCTNPDDLVTMRDIQGFANVQTTRGNGAFEDSFLVPQIRSEGYAWAMFADRYNEHDGPEPNPMDHVEPVTEGEESFTTVRLELVAIDKSGDVSFETKSLPGMAELESLEPHEESSLTSLFVKACSHHRVRVLAIPLRAQLESWNDWESVLAYCARGDVAIGLMSDPGRFVPGEWWHRLAKELGVKMLPMTQAYDASTLDDVLLSVGQARRGGWERRSVISTWNAATFTKWLTTPRGPGS